MMLDSTIHQILTYFHGFSTEVVSVFVLGFLVALLLVAWRVLGTLGLYTYQIVVLIAANIQILRTVPSTLSSEPMALGTIVFAMIYLAQDIIVEKDGKKAGNTAIWLGLLAQILFTFVMLTALWYAPQKRDVMYDAFSQLFVPSARLMISSLMAYWLSLIFNVQVFAWLLKSLKNCPLWIKVNIASGCATLFDLVIFSMMAWQWLAPEPVSNDALWMTYIVPSLIPRLLVVLLSSPMIYLVSQQKTSVRHV